MHSAPLEVIAMITAMIQADEKLRMCSGRVSTLWTSLLLLVHFTAAPDTVFAQAHTICGDPPPVADETIRAGVEGEAQILSRYIGDAGLEGEILKVRKEIFSKYRDEDERSQAYLEYQVCVLIMDDTQMTTREKIDELARAKRAFDASIEGQLKMHIEGSANPSRLGLDEWSTVKILV